MLKRFNSTSSDPPLSNIFFNFYPFFTINSFLSRRPRHIPASQQVQMDVKYRLARSAVAVEHQSISAFRYSFLFRQTWL